MLISTSYAAIYFAKSNYCITTSTIPNIIENERRRIKSGRARWMSTLVKNVLIILVKVRFFCYFIIQVCVNKKCLNPNCLSTFFNVKKRESSTSFHALNIIWQLALQRRAPECITSFLFRTF